MQVNECVLRQIRSSLGMQTEGDTLDLNALNVEELGRILRDARAGVLEDILAQIGTPDLRQPRSTSEIDLIQESIRSVLEASSESAALEKLLQHVIDHTGFLAGTVWEVVGRRQVQLGTCVLASAGTRQGGGNHKELWRLLDRMVEDRHSGAEQTAKEALTSGGFVWTETPLSSLGQFSHGEVKAAGIHAIAAFPVHVLGDYVAVLELYGGAALREDAGWVDLFRELGQQAAHGLLRKRIEAAQEAQLGLLNATVESTPAGVMAVSDEGRILFWNSQFAEIWGIAPELLETGDFELVQESCLLKLAEPERFSRRIQDQYMSRNEETRDELTFLDGRIVERCCRPLMAGGGSAGRVWTLHDVTSMREAEKERLELRDQLLHSQKMEAIGQLAGGVAHDFNNVLTAIKGYADLLFARMEESDRLRRYVCEIRNAGVRAEGLTRQLLAFSRRQAVDPRIIDVRTLVAGMEGMIRRLVRADVKLVIDLHDEPCRARVDPGRMEQVLMNLVVNARDAMLEQAVDDPAHVMRVVTKPFLQELPVNDLFPEMQPGRYVELQVVDNGCGMAQEVAERVFEPFFTTKSAGVGTGLGLSIVYGIVKQFDGFVSVESAPEIGTTIRVFLPEADESVPEPEIKVEADPSVGGDETVLLVEDEDMVRSLTRNILDLKGYQILEAANWEQALDHAANHAGKIHMVLSDVIMPEKNGPQIFEEVRVHRPEIKVLYMSGYAYDVIDGRGLIPDRSSFLQKPFGPETLASRVREILDI